MMKAGRGRLVSVASVAGYQASPAPKHGATKAAISMLEAPEGRSRGAAFR
jgi:NAD(P)-dependent dehydrogenase (short-subunit alcohol dehydrogenase family)